MTASTNKRRTVADVEAELAAFKKQTRAEAIAVAARQSWCDDGLNMTLRNLGLPEKKNYIVPVKVQMEVVCRITVSGAESEEDARSKVFADYDGDEAKFVHDYFGSDYTYIGHEIPEPVNPDTAKVGDVDPTQEERQAARLSGTTNPGGVTRRSCEAMPDDHSYFCTRPAGHPPTQHVAASNYTVAAVWPVDETHPVRIPNDH